MSESAPAPTATQPKNPWLRGPPPQLKPVAAAETKPPIPAPAGANVQDANPQLPMPPPPPPVNVGRTQTRIARAHHHLSTEEAQVHAYQLTVAQQLALAALQAGMDLAMYQAQVAISYGFDPRILTLSPEPGTRLDGTEPALGLTLVRDEQAYTHVELLTRYPHIAAINLTGVDLDPRRAAHFLVTCPERQVHESIKYGFWPISAEGAPALNRAFGEMHGVGPVYFLLASTDSVAFSGIAQMVGPASPPAVEKADGMHRIPVRWLFCKNIPFSQMNHVALRPGSKEAEEQRKMHGGMQPMKLIDGNRALTMFARHNAGTSVLMDFKYYDEAEQRGAQVESGDAAIRAVYKQQQRAMQGAVTGNERGHYGGGRGGYGGHYHNRHHYAHQQNQAGYNPTQNPAAFPTPAQAAAKASSVAQPSQPEQPQASVPQQQQPASANFSNPRPPRQFNSERGGHRGGHRAGPSRQIVTADDERVSLETKFVYEPTTKEKQSRRRRNKYASQLGEDGELYEGQDDQQQYAEGAEQPEDALPEADEE